MVPGEGLGVLEAVENLNALIEADSLSEIEVTEESRLISHKGEVQGGVREIYWVRAAVDDQTMTAVKETFSSILSYLETFYKAQLKGGGEIQRLVEGINTIMVLVSEAGEKLDRFGRLFKERVTGIKEYKELLDFYHNRVIKESYQKFATKPLPRDLSREELLEEQVIEEQLQELLGEEEETQEVAGMHILNDLEVIKRDHLYELFYLKNEAGHNFYTYSLARNIKLACDFGEFAKEYFGDDPLLQIKNWEDKGLHILSKKILKICDRRIERFYKEAMKYKQMDLVVSVHNALMALMLASNPRNLIRQFSPKGCHFYFSDFLLFLREALNNVEYQRFLVYSRPLENPFFEDLLKLVEALCYTLFTLGPDKEELQEAIKRLIERIEPRKRKILSERLASANYALTETLKKHPNGPIFKAVDIIREEETSLFDPLLQGSIPAIQGTLKSHGKELKLIQMPCPTWQEWINKAYIAEEFKTFLRAFQEGEHLLMVNFQDRTSWQEHARCFAIEEVAGQAEFADVFTVVTLAKDTDFYNQVGEYEGLEEAREFIAHFVEHLSDESAGYYFPPRVKRVLTSQFINKLLLQIHETFFEGKKRLLFLERLDFIQLAYHFIELKVIEIINPTLISLSSKDGLDIGGTSTIGLIALLTTAHKKEWSDDEIDRLHTILFGPTLMNRERVIHPERFDRLFALIHLIEKKKNYLIDFSSLFKRETLLWEVFIVE